MLRKLPEKRAGILGLNTLVTVCKFVLFGLGGAATAMATTEIGVTQERLLDCLDALEGSNTKNDIGLACTPPLQRLYGFEVNEQYGLDGEVVGYTPPSEEALEALRIHAKSEKTKLPIIIAIGTAAGAILGPQIEKYIRNPDPS